MRLLYLCFFIYLLSSCATENKEDYCGTSGYNRLSNDTAYVYTTDDSNINDKLYYYAKGGCDYRPVIVIYSLEKDKYGKQQPVNLAYTTSFTREMFLEIQKYEYVTDFNAAYNHGLDLNVVSLRKLRYY